MRLGLVSYDQKTLLWSPEVALLAYNMFTVVIYIVLVVYHLYD